MNVFQSPREVKSIESVIIDSGSGNVVDKLRTCLVNFTEEYFENSVIKNLNLENDIEEDFLRTDINNNNKNIKNDNEQEEKIRMSQYKIKASSIAAKILARKLIQHYYL